MMKNNKLGKLLSVGVASALMVTCFAPLAFAEESATAIEPDTKTLKVRVDVSGVERTSLPEKLFGADRQEGESSTIAFYEYTFTEEDDVVTYSTLGDNTIDASTFSVRNFELPTIQVSNPTKNESGYTEVASDFSFDVQKLYDNSELNGGKNVVWLKLTYTASKTSSITFNDATLDSGNGTMTTSKAKIGDLEVATLNGEKALLDETITLPTHTYSAPEDNKDHKAFAFDKYEVQVNATITGVENLTGKKVEMDDGARFSVLDDVFGLEDYAKSNNKELKDLTSVSVVITTKAYKDLSPNAVQITADDTISNVKYVKLNKKGEEVDASADVSGVNKIDGVTAADKGLLKTVKTNTSVYVGYPQNLPEVAALDSTGKAIESLVFLGWEVKSNDTNALADKITPAAGYRFEDGVVKAEVFYADQTPANTALTLVPVFLYNKEASTDVITADKPVTDPNQTGLKIYINGYLASGKITGADYYELVYGEKFEGGAFYNEEDEVFELYKTEQTGGKWEKDTTVSGIADGIYFENGVQDTKAYGLKKVVGDDSAFVYLVSDGVYQADYNGMWEDEDGSVYKLEKGCTNTTFTGVYDRGDWALSVKDSKVQKDETGFVLYGDTQYWFINGICNMKETEAVRQHTNGRFYYTVGAKIDFTFNGTVNGHTFVNGEAAE